MFVFCFPETPILRFALCLITDDILVGFHQLMLVYSTEDVITRQKIDIPFFYITIYHYLEKVIPCLFNLVGKWEPEGWGMRIIFIYLCFPLCLAPCFAFGLQRITKLRLDINISSIFKYFQYYCVSINTK